MNKTKRDELSIALAIRVVDGMDMAALVTYAVSRLNESYSNLTDEALIEEARDFAPELLEKLK